MSGQEPQHADMEGHKPLPRPSLQVAELPPEQRTCGRSRERGNHHHSGGNKRSPNHHMLREHTPEAERRYNPRESPQARDEGSHIVLTSGVTAAAE